MSALTDDYFARVRPVLGVGLSAHAVKLVAAPAQLAELQLLAELLASCMVGALLVPPALVGPVQAACLAKNPWSLPRVSGHGRGALTVHLRPGAVAALAVSGARINVTVPADEPFATRDVLCAAARLVRQRLLRLPGSAEPLGTFGDPRWPFFPRRSAIAHAPVQALSRHVVIVGAGSVGSEVARLLQPLGLRLSVVDPAQVSVFNLLRQWYDAADVGQPKAAVLAARVNGEAVVAEASPELLAALGRPDGLVLATGTHAHEPLAEWAWQNAVPHVAASAYPRARFFEVLAIDPRAGTPCFACHRGHLYRGVRSRPALPDALQSFLYSAPEAERELAYRDLVAEPAAAIETVRIASVAARAIHAMLSPVPPEWWRRARDEETVCLLGGNTTARDDATGEPAYGITSVGQVVRLGLDELCSSARQCPVCQRPLPAVQSSLPAWPHDDAEPREDEAASVHRPCDPA